jgi:hypothetical protein
VAPTIDELTLGDAPEAWRSVGFDVDGDAFMLGSVRLRLSGEGGGILGCSIRELAAEQPDGLPVRLSTAAPHAPRTDPHPNGTLGLDHLVAFSPGLDRTVPVLEAAGLDLRCVREQPTPGGAPRQAFFRLGEVILEVVETPPRSREERDPDAPSRFWGLALRVDDLDRCAAFLGERLGEPRAAVQPGRRIATLRREAGLGVAVAFMTPEPGD